MPSCAGGAFELVSCPHYLGEVVIYAGLALALAGQRVTAWLMLLWVVSRGRGAGAAVGAGKRAACYRGRRARRKAPLLPGVVSCA